MTNNNLVNELKNIYAKEKMQAEDRAQNVFNFACKNIEFSNIEKKIDAIIPNLAKAEFLGDINLSNKLNQELQDLNILKDEILIKIGIEKKDLLPKYKCSICNDSGFKDDKVCSCFKKRLSKMVLDRLNIETPKFQTFEESTAVDEQTKKYFETMQKYCEKFPLTKTKNFLFIGNTGTGKTYLAGAIADNLIKKGFNVIFLTSFYLNNIFLKYHTSFEENKFIYLDTLLSCDLLIIDDLGTEPILKNVTIEYLLGLITERQKYEKHTIITTNLSNEEIMNRYNERLFSRLCDKSNTRTIKFTNEDLRHKKD